MTPHVLVVSQRTFLTKSLEELAIIVEVLEEDLRTCTTSQSLSPSPPVSPEWSPSGEVFLNVRILYAQTVWTDS